MQLAWPGGFSAPTSLLTLVRFHTKINSTISDNQEDIAMQHTHAQLKRYNHLLGELEAVYHDLSYQLGMSDSVSKILYTLCSEGGPCRISDICLRSGLSKQTVNSALRKLETDGLIYLESAGRKAKTVCLTEAGTSFAQKTAMRILDMENEILTSWAPEEVTQYMDLTERFLLALRERTAKL